MRMFLYLTAVSVDIIELTCLHLQYVILGTEGVFAYIDSRLLGTLFLF